MKYQVFIEGTKNPAGLERVASSIAERYGLPAETLQQRMSQGRFRVKNNVELSKAREFAAELDSLGAVASIVDEHGKTIGDGADAGELDLMLGAPGAPEARGDNPFANISASGDAPTPPKVPAGPLAGITGERKAATPDSPLAGITGERKAASPDSPLAGITAERKAVQETTGLAAAGKSDEPLELGALEGDDFLSLASIDGAEQVAAPSEVGPSKVAPVDDENAFLPPEATGAAPALELDAALPERPPEPAMAMDDAPLDAGAVVAGADASLGEARASRDSALKRLWDVLDKDSRKRFAVGVLLATLVGIVPMHLYATMTENDAYGAMRKDLAETQALVQDVDEWENLEPIRQEVARTMDKKRVNIAITSGLIWLVVAGGLGYLYFRRLPWEDLGPRIAPHNEGGGVSLS